MELYEINNLNRANDIEIANEFVNKLKNGEKPVLFTYNAVGGRTTKPKGKELGVENINTTTQILTNIDGFIKIFEENRTWRPYTFSKYRKSNDGIGTAFEDISLVSTFVLDFDSGVKYERLLELYKSYNIEPSLIYTTFSHTEEHHKFRFVWFCDDVFMFDNEASKCEYVFIEECLGLIANELKHEMLGKYKNVYDESCLQTPRLYLTGLNIIHQKFDYIIDCGDLLTICIAKRVVKDGGRYKNISDVIYNRFSKNYKNNSEDCDDDTDYTELKRAFNWDLAISRVAWLREFDSLNIWLHYSEVVDIATNLVHIEGGTKYMIDKITKIQELGVSAYTTDQFKNVIASINAISKNRLKYRPANFKNFSQFAEDFKYRNIFDAVDVKQVDVIDATPKISIDDARKLFTETFTNDFINKQVGTLSLYKVGTGVGKTNLIKQMNNVVIAFPTHAKANEVYAELIADNVQNVYKTPEYPIFNNILDEIINNKFKLSEIGSAAKIIYLISTKTVGELVFSYELTASDILIAKNFVKSNDDAINTTIGIVLTTHTKAVFQQFKMETIIFDEDPTTSNTILRHGSIKSSEFDKCFEAIKKEKSLNLDSKREVFEFLEYLESEYFDTDFDNCKQIDEIYTDLLNNLQNVYKFLFENTNNTDFDFSIYKNIFARGTADNPNNMLLTLTKVVNKYFKDSKILEIINADFVLRDFDYDRMTINGKNVSDKKVDYVLKANYKHLSKKRCFIMSATLSKDIIEKEFSNIFTDISYLDISNVKGAGKIIQNIENSNSKSSFTTRIGKENNIITNDQNKKWLDFVNTKFDAVITAKSMKFAFKLADDEIHFGNSSGYNKLSGKNIAVIGTYNRPKSFYILSALALGHKIENISQFDMFSRKIKYNGISFKMFTFKDDFLMNIQCFYINSELVQAAGRNRTVNNNCTCYIESNFPIAEADAFISDYKNI
jgi:hypothetical protein